MKRGPCKVAASVVLAMAATWPIATACAQAAAGSDLPGRAQKILEESGVQGGLVVHLGCGDGRLTAALRARESFLVHGLDADAGRVERARRHLQSLGLYGPVSVDRLRGSRLPYVDNLVQLIVVEEPAGVPMGEVTRVLAPGGVACVWQGGQWTRSIKPRPAEIDEWTHFLHDATNNAVSKDQRVGPPHQLQWVGGPTWQRSHEHLASVSALVASGGRVFSIEDEGPIVAVVLQPQWQLVARDAFSGVVLWKRSISLWPWHLRGFRSGPSDIARRLVAVGDRVYATLGIGQPLSALHAATGQTLIDYVGTEGALEVVHADGILYVVAGDPQAELAAEAARRRGERPGLTAVLPQRPEYPEPPPRKRLLAIHAQTGKTLWTKGDADTAELMPTTLAVRHGRTFFQNPDEILCLDAASGKEIWRTRREVSRHRPAWSAPTLVVYGDVVLSGDRAVAERPPDAPADDRQVYWYVTSAGGQSPEGELIAFSARTGERLWSCPAKECYNAPVDVLVAGGLVWTGRLVTAKEPGITEGRSPKTGEVVRTRPADQQFFQPGMGHHRCYRNKATERFLLLGRSGVELIDVATGEAVANHWTRGTCQYGVMPANGLLYVPPHTCACFITAKLDGFNCLAPKRKADSGQRTAEEGDRLERGPAYEETTSRLSAVGSPLSEDWPTYRHDAARSGCAASPVPGQLQEAWRVRLGGRLSSIVVAEGKLLVAQIDAHTVHALDAADGRPLWIYTAGGRVDSPPTVWQGRVLFGSADGWVYCLRADTGALAWRFRAAPADERIVSYGQIESLWPVPGSVLLHDGVVHCAAGRSSYLEGGIRVCRLDARTGRLLSETVLDDRDPQTGYQRKDAVQGTNIPGALPDVLSCDGHSVFMRHQRFDLEGKPQLPNVPHLFSSAGFLSDQWWHRTYWMIGAMMGTNYGGWPNPGNAVPAGRILVCDDQRVFGFGRNQYIRHGAHVGIDGATVFHFRPDQEAERRFTYYQAFAIDRDKAGVDPAIKPAPKAGPKPAGGSAAKPAGKPAAKPAARSAARRQPPPPPKQYRWTQKLPILVRGMVLAGDRLFMAGPPDLLLARDPCAAWQGTEGGKLLTASASDGSILAELPLQSPPVFDGLIAARGRLYLATTDGHVISLAAR